MIDEKILIVAGFLVVLVNLITEVAKQVALKSSKVINLFVLFISVLLTILAYVYYMHFTGGVVDGYGFIASIIGGVLVAYSAMFGFDKLLKYFEPFIKED